MDFPIARRPSSKRTASEFGDNDSEDEKPLRRGRALDANGAAKNVDFDLPFSHAEWVTRKIELQMVVKEETQAKFSEAFNEFRDKMEQLRKDFDDTAPLNVDELIQSTRGEDRTDENWLPTENKVMKNALELAAALDIDDDEIDCTMKLKYRVSIQGIPDESYFPHTARDFRPANYYDTDEDEENSVVSPTSPAEWNS